MFIVDIDWPSSGHERYSYIGQTVSGFTGNVQARLISVSELVRAMREDKELENNTVTVQLVDTDEYFSSKFAGADQYIRGRTVAVYDDTTLLFTGYVSSLPESQIGTFSITATLFDQLSTEINKKITVTEFPNVDSENAGQYSNYIFGHVCDEHIQDPIGEMLAFRVDTRKYLLAWHYIYGNTALPRSTISEDYYDWENWHTSYGGDLLPVIKESGDWSSNWSKVEAGGTAAIDITSYRFSMTTYDVTSSGAGTTYIYPTTDTALAATTKYYFNFWHFTPSGKNAEYCIKELSGTPNYLKADGTWTTTETWLTDAGTGDWKWLHLELSTNGANDYRFMFGKTVSDSFTIKFTDITLGTDGYTYLIFDTDVADAELVISFNGYGYPKSNGPNIASGIGYLINPLTCLDTMNTLVGSPIIFDGLTAAETEATSRAYSAMFAITDGMTWRQFLSQFARNFDLNIWQEVDGKIGLKMLEWGEETSTITLGSAHIIDFKNRKDITQIASRVRRMYSWHMRKQYFAKLPIDVISSTAWVGDDVNLDLRWTEDNATSLDVATRYKNIYQEPLNWVTVTVNKDIAKSIELGDVLTIIYPKGYYPNGERLVQVFKKTYGDSFITLDTLGISVIVDGTFRLWDDSDPKVVLIHDEADADCEVLL